ncbi:MAG: pirin family protein [Fimbriimonadaceae bacterium]|nr:pirin family protein [Fimbriimonadaceae bacterium]
MTQRRFGFAIEPSRADEAKGVDIRRSIGTDRMVYLDPILLCDHLRLDHVPGIGRMGFPRHPHRGITTFTVVLRGVMHHRDSLGNVSAVGPGGIQVMQAGSGLFHEEMMESEGSGVEVVQLWFNHPNDRRLLPPAYTAHPAESLPKVELGPASLTVAAGRFGEASGPSQEVEARPNVGVLRWAEAGSVVLAVGEEDQVFACLVSGSLETEDGLQTGPLGLVWEEEGDSINLVGTAGTELVIVSAPKLNQPFVQYRSSVLGSVTEAAQAVRDLRDGTFTDHPVQFN